MSKLLWRFFMFWKYRLVTIDLEDGSHLVGALTDKQWESLKKGMFGGLGE